MDSLRSQCQRTRFASTVGEPASHVLLTDSLPSHFWWTSFAHTFGRLASLATAAPDVNSSDLAYPPLLALALALASAHRSLLQPAVAAVRLLRAYGCCSLKCLNRNCDADEKACYDFYKKSKGSIHSIKTTFPSMRIVVLMHIVVLIIVVPFQTKTDVTTSSSEGFSLYVIKDAHRSVDHCSTASNENGRNDVEL